MNPPVAPPQRKTLIRVDQSFAGPRAAVVRWRAAALPLALALVCFGLPQSASANAGTPLMWASMLHLVFGNAFIGLLEGALLAKLFRLSWKKCLAVMIAANYGSAWLGGLFIRGAIVNALPLNLNNAWMWFWIMVAATYLLTLLLEWPFIAWCFRGQAAWLKRSLKASLVVQAISYVLLFGWYWGASGVSLYTRMNIVALSDLSLPEAVLVYYIEPTSGDVHARRLTGTLDQKVFPLSSKDLDDRLFERPSLVEAGHCEIVARLEGVERNSPRLVTVVSNLAAEVGTGWEDRQQDENRPDGNWFSFGPAARLGSATNSAWDFRSGFWPIEGLTAKTTNAQERVRFAYETPFGQWAVRNAVHLPTDQVMFQLGPDQICVFDPKTRQVALLWRGRGPVAVLPREGMPARANPPVISP